MTTALKPFQEEIAAAMADCIGAVTRAMQAAPTDRSRLAREIGAVLLEAPTGSGKTLMLANTLRQAVGGTANETVWLWVTPYTGIVAQTTETLRAEAPELRLCDIQSDRNPALRRDGDVFVFTWAAVSTRNQGGRRARADGDANPSLDSMLAELRERGWYIGLVIDEAHLNLGQNAAQAMAFVKEAVRPDCVLMATATPRDEALRHFCGELRIDPSRLNRFAVARRDVVAERLNKAEVRAVHFHAEERTRALLDFEEIALRFGLRTHEQIKARLAERDVAVTPLLLVQVASTEGAEQRAKAMLMDLGMAEEKIAIHTAREPDQAVHTIAYDDTKEVLIFKLAVATGFDAPRAWGLVSLRGSRGVGFGLQIIGRIMRIHRALQAPEHADPMLDSGYVFLADPEAQGGLALAAEELEALVGEIRTVTDDVRIFEVSSGGTVALTDPDNGFMSVLSRPEDTPSAPDPAGEAGETARPAAAFDTSHDFIQTLLGPLPATAGDPVPASTGQRRAGRTPSGMDHYPLRDDLDFPNPFTTERMPPGTADLSTAIANQIRIDGDFLAMLGRSGARITVTEEQLFAQETERHQERVQFSAGRLRLRAAQAFRFNQHIDERVLKRRLLEKLRAEADRAGYEVDDVRPLRRAVDLFLAERPNLVKDACREALALHVELEPAGPLPETLLAPAAAEPARKGLYGIFPDGLNSWEYAFARLMDEDERGIVTWWHRNPSNSPHSVAIVRPNGRRYFPDFIAGIRVTGADRAKLIEIKGMIETQDSREKVRTRHRDYGPARMLFWHQETREWFEVLVNTATYTDQLAGRAFDLPDLAWEAPPAS